jgi:glycosyltransferase involved in cell wall biosynthesis
MTMSSPLRIAQLCPLWEPVPPSGYGGIELVVNLLTEELVRRGHQVTLLASGDSQTTATLQAPCDYALRLDPTAQGENLWRLNRKHQALQQQQINWLIAHRNEFDVVHSHLELDTANLVQRCTLPTVQTMHMDLIPESIALFTETPNLPLISISNAQRVPCPSLNYLETVYNAIAIDTFPFVSEPQTPPYLAFLGRLSPEKGIDLAIKLALNSGLPLKIAGKAGQEDQEFFDSEVKPHVDGQQIQYLGEVTQAEKMQLLGQAALTLFPITWNEPFGLVMVESMACGTPVLGLGLGAVPEVIDPGITGLISNTLGEMIAQIPAALALDRDRCRTHVESRFSVVRMADDYEACYRRAIASV